MIKKIIKLSKEVSNYCVGMEGNVSCKDSDRFYIKASGSKLKNIKKKDIIIFDKSRKQISSLKKKASIEMDFHLFLLSFEHVNYVTHTHPINSVKILCSKHKDIFSNKRLFPDQVIFNGIKSCLIEYATPGKELANKIEKGLYSFIEKEKFFPNLILLENHGIIACGKTANECIIITEICEKSAEILLDCISIGDVQFLTEENITNLVNDKKEKYRKDLL